MLKKILVANRGEIAVRIIRECQDCGIPAVAVFSEADRNSLRTLIADEAVCIGPGNASGSYLNMDNILQAAMSTGCDGIHPGFGLLSENAEFARKCRENDIKFIGPDGDTISKMGDKSTARQMMMKAGVPVVPGSDGAVKTPEEALKVAERIGYPVLVKASAGGGGRGMRRADSPEELPTAMEQAGMEAAAAFGDGTVYLEKLIINPRHIEVQVLGDQHHNVIHLGERNCSIQRRNQKMLEEAPAFGLQEETRKTLCEAAVAAAKACDYEGAGTVEFVMDDRENFYFIEMNTRIQVEHPVTEMVTGINIVAEQYPDLKANQNFQELMTQLQAVEGDIANARKYYNACVKKFNVRLKSFPSNIIGSMFHFEMKTMFEVSSEIERENVKVSFDK